MEEVAMEQAAVEKGKTDSPFLQALTTARIIDVPLAETWKIGTVFKDLRSGQVVAKVVKNEKYGRTADGQPKWRLTLSDENDNIIAVVRRKIENAKDVFVVYSTEPNWPGQVPKPHKEAKGSTTSQFDVYPLVEIQQSTFGQDYVVTSYQDKQILMKASDEEITWAMVCCPFAFFCRTFKWNLRFVPRGGRVPTIVRNQKTEEVQVAPGASALLGICIAYAVDRVTIITC